jgi:hypothetical protein
MYKYGKAPARPDAVELKFSAVFNDPLPVPPKSFGHVSGSTNWTMLANDIWGDCVEAGGAHEHMVWTAEGSQKMAQFTSAGVLSDYSAITGFDPNNPDSDQGTDMQQAAAYRQTVGYVDAFGNRHKIDAYAALEAGNLDQLAVAAWIFGAVGVGVRVPSTMQHQFMGGQPWAVVPNDKIVGGHYIPCVGRNSAGNFVFITWGRLQAATPAWVATYMDEGLAYLSLEVINNTTKLSPEGFNLDILSKYLKGV